MVCEQYFRIKRNGEAYSNCYCRHPELIENYDKAIADNTQMWQVHHRLECCFTQKFLKEMNLYYDVEPEALIFLTPSEHSKIDSRCKRTSEATKRGFSEEHKRKIVEVLSKKVLCVETNEVFESVRDAYRKTGVFQSNISRVCNGERKTTGGYHWKFV